MTPLSGLIRRGTESGAGWSRAPGGRERPLPGPAAGRAGSGGGSPGWAAPRAGHRSGAGRASRETPPAPVCVPASPVPAARSQRCVPPSAAGASPLWPLRLERKRPGQSPTGTERETQRRCRVPREPAAPRVVYSL